MIRLAANYSTALLGLIRSGDIVPDLIEVGPWFSPQMIRSFQDQLPGWSFLFHASNQISFLSPPRKRILRLKTYLEITRSPWASVHINLLLPGAFFLAKHFGLRIPLPAVDWRTHGFISQARRLKNSLNVPLVLENMPVSARLHNFHEGDPRRIAQILQETGVDFLLDTSHARVAANVLGWDVYDYLEALPLNRVIAIHASGPRLIHGCLSDEHEALQDEDYKVIAWLLERTQLQVLTLEYFRDPDPLRKQLIWLKALLEGC
jgi:uncharacterized protein (UPF0276 family)